MASMTRRQLLALAASYGASLTERAKGAAAPRWRERRDLYPHGVASGDPHADSVILWTRRLATDTGRPARLHLEIAEDPEFRRLAGTAEARVSEATDWTCRVLAANLKPRRVYWFRFTDERGFGSRIGRRSEERRVGKECRSRWS